MFSHFPICTERAEVYTVRNCKFWLESCSQGVKSGSRRAHDLVIRRSILEASLNSDRGVGNTVTKEPDGQILTSIG
jgi:hypothetical protein